ncbi:hypothetical protein GFGA_1c0858 [Gluconobacter frateurii NBRC 103465]|nr:hypothetical protein GFGA_1c0858 [Gluconobacter frateurii NBRC 103465]
MMFSAVLAQRTSRSQQPEAVQYPAGKSRFSGSHPLPSFCLHCRDTDHDSAVTSFRAFFHRAGLPPAFTLTTADHPGSCRLSWIVPASPQNSSHSGDRTRTDTYAGWTSRLQTGRSGDISFRSL